MQYTVHLHSTPDKVEVLLMQSAGAVSGHMEDDARDEHFWADGDRHLGVLWSQEQQRPAIPSCDSWPIGYSQTVSHEFYPREVKRETAIKIPSPTPASPNALRIMHANESQCCI